MKNQPQKKSPPKKAESKNNPAKKPSSKKADAAKKPDGKGGILSDLAFLLTELIDTFVETCIDCGFNVVTVSRKTVAGRPSKPVPVNDRIKIPARVVNECKKAAKADKKAKAKKVVAKKGAAPLFTADEQAKILSLRKRGLSIKKVAKAIGRRDKSVAAFLKTIAPAEAK